MFILSSIFSFTRSLLIFSFCCSFSRFFADFLLFVTVFSLTLSFTSEHIGPNEEDEGRTPLNRSGGKRAQFYYCLFIFLPAFCFL